ncbi:MAG TPA: hypothetical protein VJT71_19195 [Pyrinomonadaceae bacterium]|nr:hypothetical protein [Pyrinomonadaceae bacterium]
MITTTFKSWIDSAKNSLTNLRALIIFAVLYALLLGTFYIFVSTREATVWQVLVTYLFLLLIPAEFFALQAAIINSARGLGFDWKRILRDALKIFVATIPVLILGWLIWLLVNKLAGRWPAPLPPPVFDLKAPRSQPVHWPSLLFSTLRFLLFAVALPLAAIHLWIEATARDVRAAFAGGARAFFKRIADALARAFASESVFIYGLGLIVFALIPYAILSWKPNIKGTKTDFTVFILQVVLAFAFILFGWIVTLATLVRSRPEPPEPEVVAPAAVAEAAA